MPDPKSRALELVDRLFANVLDFHDEQAGEQQTRDLRAAMANDADWQLCHQCGGRCVPRCLKCGEQFLSSADCQYMDDNGIPLGPIPKKP